MFRRTFLVTSGWAAAFGSMTATIKSGYAPVNGLEITRSMARVSRWCCCTASTVGRQERRRLGRIGHIERPGLDPARADALHDLSPPLLASTVTAFLDAAMPRAT